MSTDIHIVLQEDIGDRLVWVPTPYDDEMPSPHNYMPFEMMASTDRWSITEDWAEEWRRDKDGQLLERKQYLRDGLVDAMRSTGPIVQYPPRGWPDRLCPHIKRVQCYQAMWCALRLGLDHVDVVDFHTHSWLYAAELEAVLISAAAIPKVGTTNEKVKAWRADAKARNLSGDELAETFHAMFEVQLLARWPEMDEVLSIMRRHNMGDPTRTQLIYWFDN